MERRHFLLVATALSALSTAPVLAQDAGAIHRGAIVIDAHADVPSPSSRAGQPGTIDAGSQIDFAKLRTGQVDAMVASVFVEQGPRTPEGYAAARAEADAKLAAIRAIAETRPDQAVIALTPADVERAAAEGKTAIVIGLLNAYSLGRDPAALQGFYDRGVRIVGLTHAGNNDFSDSSRPQARDTPGENGGLSPAGVEAIRLANRLGVLVDVSQLSSEAFTEALATTRAPVIATLPVGSEGELTLYATVAYVGDRFSDVQNQQSLPAYTEIDAGVTWDVNDRVQVQLVGDNLTDEIGLTEGNPRALGAQGSGVILARPILGRSVRFSVGYRF